MPPRDMITKAKRRLTVAVPNLCWLTSAVHSCIYDRLYQHTAIMTYAHHVPLLLVTSPDGQDNKIERTDASANERRVDDTKSKTLVGLWLELSWSRFVKERTTDHGCL